ncbi:MAG: SDR family NAD(P)-dependent oxidoreductase, partial [Owenweeksia sp.]
ERESKIDVLVNNAGWGGLGFIETYSLEQAKKQFEVNVFGVFNVTKAVLPFMRSHRNGLVVNISSIVGRAVFPMFSMYCASKYAVEGMSQSWKYEWAPISVDSVIVEPGIYPTTNFFAKLENNSPASNEAIGLEYGDLAKMPQAFGENVQQMVESGNFNDPQLVADTILKLCRTPYGQRPIRVVADPVTEGLYQPYNDQAEKLQNQFLEMFLGN